MPELPEIESLRRSLAPDLLGHALTLDRLYRPDIVRASWNGPLSRRGRQTLTPPEQLSLSKVQRLERRGKQLAIVGEDGRVLCVQLGMSGRLLLSQSTQPQPPHTHAQWSVRPIDPVRGSHASSLVLRFVDPRRFGGLGAFESFEALLQRAWSRLGPDALDLADSDLRRLARGRRSIKATLLDQAALAGVGNIYADESLFLARIDPARRAGSLREHECDRLAAAVRAVLSRAVESGGSTLRDYVDAQGRPGSAQSHHNVYGRSGQPCPLCARPLRSRLLAQRTTVWCPFCQPRRPSRHIESRGNPKPPSDANLRHIRVFHIRPR